MDARRTTSGNNETNDDASNNDAEITHDANDATDPSHTKNIGGDATTDGRRTTADEKRTPTCAAVPRRTPNDNEPLRRRLDTRRRVNRRRRNDKRRLR
jgi:hypothetical protein